MWSQKLVFILIAIEFCMSHQNERFRPIQPTTDVLIKGMTVKYDKSIVSLGHSIQQKSIICD